MDFKTLPDKPFTLHNVTIPACFIANTKTPVSDSTGLLQTDISIADSIIASSGGLDIDMAGAMVLPAFVDMHTHLDKGHIMPRASNPDGSFAGALQSVRTDHAHWNANDIHQRADFALRCAYAHGTRAVRTHLDSAPPQDEISWPVFSELREQWRGRIELQASSLTGCDQIDINGRFQRTADLVQQHGGALGLVTYPIEGLLPKLCEFLSIAATRDLEVDFHVDESMDPNCETLRDICHAVQQTGFDKPVTVGHVCSLSAQDEHRALQTLDLVKEVGLNVVSLPMCNLYLQDRQPGITPRRRGVTLVHEMKARGIPVAFASDNTRDPFYAYGDLDMLEVLRETTRIAHLDHSDPDWINAFSTIPAKACGFGPVSLTAGAPADLVIFRARNWTELLSRPQTDRIVLRDGAAIDRTLPDYAELDALF